ncbi:Uncharacterized protein FWK35_00029498 [Aphis craccivora]|uniref:Uncharacterized protein n=1 Tax=Aphis craccivora TaxID=307492 RepID=A0A6G0W2T3_APHCR|nr:Uncharacterized protein FWK35_00029498 [Aphis craccivora]
MQFENNNNIGLIDSDSDSLLNTYYYGCLSSDDDDVNQPIPTNNNDLWCIDDSSSEHYNSDIDPKYIPPLIINTIDCSLAVFSAVW